MIREMIAEFTKPTDLKPLQQLAAVKTTIAVCESGDVQSMIAKFRNTNGNGGAVGFSDYQWIQLVSKVKEKLKEMGVSKIIMDRVLENLWPIAFEISKWIIYHFEDTDIECSPNFCWTPQGSIDYLKTAANFVRNEELSLKKRFAMACIYCMESEIRSLWAQMNLPERRSFFSRAKFNELENNQIVRFWTYYIQDLPLDYWSRKALKVKYLFIYAMNKGYIVATKFFLGKIRDDRKHRMFTEFFIAYIRKLNNPKLIVKDHLAITCFLLDLRPSDFGFYFDYLVFKYFLEWPMQKHFLTAVSRLRQRLTDKIFLQLLAVIFVKDIGGFKDFDYKKLFKEFWRQSPQQYKAIVSTRTRLGYQIFMKFAEKHFGFLFEENAFRMKAKFRAIVFLKKSLENVTHFEVENVDFFKFLVEEQVISKSSLERFSQLPRFNGEEEIRFLTPLDYELQINLPLGELKYLMDGILEGV